MTGFYALRRGFALSHQVDLSAPAVDTHILPVHQIDNKLVLYHGLQGIQGPQKQHPPELALLLPTQGWIPQRVRQRFALHDAVGANARCQWQQGGDQRGGQSKALDLLRHRCTATVARPSSRHQQHAVHAPGQQLCADLLAEPSGVLQASLVPGSHVHIVKQTTDDAFVLQLLQYV